MHDASGNMIHRDERLANAAFIVRACNSHDALVAALRELFDTHIEAEDPAAGCDDWVSMRDVPGAKFLHLAPIRVAMGVAS